MESCVLPLAVYLRVRRWTDAALLAAAHVVHGLLLRSLTTRALLGKWASAWQHTWWVALLGLLLGALEDLCVFVAAYALYRLLDKRCSNSSSTAGGSSASTYGGQPATAVMDDGAAAVMDNSVALVVDAVPAPVPVPATPSRRTLLRGWLAHAAPDIARFAGFALVFALSNALFFADAVLVRTRQLRFSVDFVRMYVHERDAASELQIDDSELLVLYEHATLTSGFALLVGFFGAVWVNPTEWDVLRSLHRVRARQLGWSQRAANRYDRVPSSDNSHKDGDVDADGDASSDAQHTTQSRSVLQRVCTHVSTRSLLALLLVAFVAATVTTTKFVPSVVAMVALNASLNEPLRLLCGLELFAIRHADVAGYRRMSDFVEHATEDAELFNDDSLFRHTRGFRGPLAFNVSVAPGEQLNVLMVVVESFRQHDSQYLLHAQRYAELYGADMPSLTPQFDKWARRGVAFRNMWSSWRTSRALETILFGQVPYDSVTATGTTTGRADVALAGLPQLFKARGYECIFTTGTRTDYDDWDAFLPTHGFDHVLDMWDLADIATDEIGIDVSEGEQMMAYWGIHDHLSFDVLGYLLQKHAIEHRNGTFHGTLPRATAESNATTSAPPPSPRRSDALDTHKPWFVTHFTISSHVPFDERPDWYHRYGHELPDFSSFYRDAREHAELLKNYAEMRYFADLTFGHFMDNLNASGVLANTLVVVTGDHGQAPERGSATPEQDQMAATRVAGALIAEGRLGASAGLLFDDVASHSDLLNTIADIVGVSELDGGFLQSGVGHSLKRAVPFGERVVHSNNPAVNMAAVQGHTRIQYYSTISDAVQAYHTDFDPMQEHDLMGELSPERVQQILQICAEGRMLSDYFKHRWDHACILAPTC